jgi:hypothetical protein
MIIQINPAALILLPGIEQDDIKNKYSSHQDFIMPTPFELIVWMRTIKPFMTGNPSLSIHRNLITPYLLSYTGELIT